MEDSEYESLPTEKVSVHLMAGAIAGVMEHCVMYPVDSVKVHKITKSRLFVYFDFVYGLKYQCCTRTR